MKAGLDRENIAHYIKLLPAGYISIVKNPTEVRKFLGPNMTACAPTVSAAVGPVSAIRHCSIIYCVQFDCIKYFIHHTSKGTVLIQLLHVSASCIPSSGSFTPIFKTY